MSQKLIALFVTISITVLCAGCDYLLKHASLHPRPFTSVAFWVGLAGYAISVFVWVFVLGCFKLVTVGAIYCVTLVLLLALGGVLIFGEKLNSFEILGLIFACASIVLLTRFT